MTETYEIKYKCENCSWRGVLGIKKGTPKPAKKRCPNCECETCVLDEYVKPKWIISPVSPTY